MRPSLAYLLVLALAWSGAGAFEPLENEGLPQFAQGLYIVNSLAGEAAGSQFLNTILVSNTTHHFSTMTYDPEVGDNQYTHANFSSWECVRSDALPGAFRAIHSGYTLDPSGAIVGYVDRCYLFSREEDSFHLLRLAVAHGPKESGVEGAECPSPDTLDAATLAMNVTWQFVPTAAFPGEPSPCF
ncbi:hypothetical protein COHA_003081 [Chlorella ohadii]|uniref:Uncharacterized protein n=1 Tax=Chlorella ohadii TaxID=2649997 RepID=A0AAD5H875_9CHLO|nr:hypothetical protein COHA_003081 [Chlorella ohadii]